MRSYLVRGLRVEYHDDHYDYQSFDMVIENIEDISVLACKLSDMISKGTIIESIQEVILKERLRVNIDVRLSKDDLPF